MSTTELAFEQVLVGALVLAAVALPLFDVHPLFGASSAPEAVFRLALVIAAAYAIGVPFDRVADTLVSGLEQRHRLSWAWRNGAPIGKDSKDPFKEYEFAARTLHAGNGDAEWLGYLRARARIARSIAVFGPAAAAGVWCAIARMRYRELDRTGLLISIAVAYGTAFVVASYQHLPRTDGTSDTEARHAHASACRCTTRYRDPIPYVLSVPLLALLVGTAAVAFRDTKLGWPTDLSFIAVVGTTTTALSLWAWFRLRTTIMKFVE